MAIFTAIATAVTAVAGFIGSLGFLGQLALGAALSIGANLLLGGSQRRPQLPTFNNPAPQYQAVINQSSAARRRGYGRAKLGGVRAFFESNGGVLYQIVMIHQGRIDAYEQFFLGDQVVTLSGTGSVEQAPFALSATNAYAFLYPRVGEANQSAESGLITDFPGIWTSDHRLRGIAYITSTFRSPPSESYLRIFPEGYNTPVMAVCRLSRVLDTRTNTTAWSDNPALCIMDYLTHPDGYRRLSYDDFDIPSFNAFADLCDEAVSLAAGGTEKRYRLWGVYELNDSPTEVLQRMLLTCDGELYTTREGKLAIRGGQWNEPTITIDETQILGHDMEEGADALDRFNQLKIVYTDPDQDYQSTEAQPWDDLADQAVRGLQTQDFTVDMCPSPSQARRLAKITIAKSNPRWSGTIRTNLAGLKARGERIIRVVLPELQIDQTFLVGSHKLILDGGLPVACEMQVLSLSASAYAWDPATEEGQAPPPPQDTAPDFTLEVPSNLQLVVDRRQVTEATTVSVVLATVDPPTRDDSNLEAQIRRDGSSIWEAMGVASGEMEAVSGALIDNETYFVRARFRTAGAASGWTAEEDITVVTNPNAPAAPTELSVAISGDDIDVEWRNPSANFYRARVYRNSADSFSGATQIAEIAGVAGQISGYRDPDPGEGTWYYWVTARNESGVEGDPAGSVSETIPAPE